jgi:hypothetical protein
MPELSVNTPIAAQAFFRIKQRKTFDSIEAAKITQLPVSNAHHYTYKPRNGKWLNVSVLSRLLTVCARQ